MVCKVKTYRLPWLNVNLIGTNNPILIFLDRGLPLDKDGGGVEGFGGDITWLPRYWNVALNLLLARIRHKRQQLGRL